MFKTALPTALIACALGACSSFAPSPSTVARPSAPPRPTVVVTLTAQEAAMVRAYYASAEQSRGKGRGRSGGLPPGIAKNVQRGKALPPGIAKQYLPSDLAGRLPPAGSGLEYVVVAGKLLLVEVATQVVRDVLLEALFG